MGTKDELSIANLSWLSDSDYFLLQVCGKSDELDSFIKNSIPGIEKNWLADLNSWEIKNKWLLKISDICLKEFDQVFYDQGEELLDLKDSENYQKFREKILEELM